MTHCVFEARAKNRSLDFVAIDNAEEYEQFLQDQELLNGPQGIPDFLRSHSLSHLRDGYQLVSQLCTIKNSNIVTRYLFDLVPRLVAEKLRVLVRSVFSNPSQVVTCSLREQFFFPVHRSEINQIRVTRDLQAVSRENHDFGYPSIGVALWPEWFAQSNVNCPIRVVSVGFIREDDATEADFPPAIKDILNCGKTPVLITAGTSKYVGSEFYRIAAKAGERLDFARIPVMQSPTQLPNDCYQCVS